MMISESPINLKTKKVPETFDELAAEIDHRFRMLEDAVKEIHEEIREADANSETLGRRLLGKTHA